MLLSVVFSFRNEKENLQKLIERVNDALKSDRNVELEFVFVDDASNDGSAQELVRLQKKYPITIITMSRRFGVTPCVLAGLEHACGDAVVYMDADLQDPPELIPQMLEAFRQGAEVVHTRRSRRLGEGRIKLFVTRLGYKLINYFSELELPENTGDFKLLSRRVVNNITALSEYDPYMRGLSVWVGFDQQSITYERDRRWKGKTKFPLISSNPLREFVRGITSYSAAPLYTSLFLGFLSVLVAVLLIAWALVAKLLGISAYGSSGILIAIAFFSGMILVTNGLLGIYVSKIFYETKQRPRFVIRDINRHPKDR